MHEFLCEPRVGKFRLCLNNILHVCILLELMMFLSFIFYRMARNWRTQMLSRYGQTNKQKALHAARMQAWKDGEYGRRWTSNNRKDPGVLLILRS